MSVTCDSSVVFSGSSDSLHQWKWRHDITEILLTVALNIIKHQTHCCCNVFYDLVFILRFPTVAVMLASKRAFRVLLLELVLIMTCLIKIRHSQSSKLDTPWPKPVTISNKQYFCHTCIHTVIYFIQSQAILLGFLNMLKEPEKIGLDK